MKQTSILLLFLCTILFVGCSAPIIRTPVPHQLLDKAKVEGFRNIRFWGDETPTNIRELVKTKISQTKKYRPQMLRGGTTLNYLAISGGADNGAFGAGFLTGWSQKGTRPQFEIVTGISTGALAAPFAFLGQKYDKQLQEIFTTYSTQDLVTKNLLSGIFGGSSIANNSGMVELITKYISHELLQKIAIEHKKGRRLLIGTTNLDAQRAVIWDMGAIAASNHPKALTLFRKVIEASAAIPGIFPPVILDVSANGIKKDELHIDGGPTAEVFFLPTKLIQNARRVSTGLPKIRHNLYIIRNGRLNPQWKAIEPKTIEIARRSISTLIKYQGIGDLYQLYIASKKNRMNFNLVSIPRTFKGESKEPFDQKYMQQLFTHARNMAKQGYHWKSVPPGL